MRATADSIFRPPLLLPPPSAPASPRVRLRGDGHTTLEELRVRTEDVTHDLLCLAAAVRQRGVHLGVPGLGFRVKGLEFRV